MKLMTRPAPTRAKALHIGVLLLALGALGACSSDDDDTTPTPSTGNDPTNGDAGAMPGDEAGEGTDTDPGDASDSLPDAPDNGQGGSRYAFVATRAPDFGSGRVDRLSLEAGITLDASLPATLSDIRVDTDGTNVYQIGRFNVDSITRYDPVDIAAPVYQYSTNGDETASNPQDIAFVDDSKAYVTRYGSSEAWIINPSATSEAEFRIGELDLSAYDADAPNMTDALIVGDRLYVLMERLTEFTPDKPGYVAVFDITQDTEIDTGRGEDGLLGIALETVNPSGLHYNEASNEILVVGRGFYFASEAEVEGSYTGGLEVIDVDTFESSLLLDDGTAASNEGGYFFDALVVSASRGYLLTYAAFGSTTLRSFNPTTGVLDDEPVGELVNKDLTDLSLAPDGRVWVGRSADSETGEGPGFVLIDPSDNTVIDETVSTELVPINTVFVEAGDSTSATP